MAAATLLHVEQEEAPGMGQVLRSVAVGGCRMQRRSPPAPATGPGQGGPLTDPVGIGQHLFSEEESRVGQL